MPPILLPPPAHPNWILCNKWHTHFHDKKYFHCWFCNRDWGRCLPESESEFTYTPTGGGRVCVLSPPWLILYQQVVVLLYIDIYKHVKDKKILPGGQNVGYRFSCFLLYAVDQILLYRHGPYNIWGPGEGGCLKSVSGTLYSNLKSMKFRDKNRGAVTYNVPAVHIFTYLHFLYVYSKSQTEREATNSSDISLCSSKILTLLSKYYFFVFKDLYLIFGGDLSWEIQKLSPRGMGEGGQPLGRHLHNNYTFLCCCPVFALFLKGLPIKTEKDMADKACTYKEKCFNSYIKIWLLLGFLFKFEFDCMFLLLVRACPSCMSLLYIHAACTFQCCMSIFSYLAI